MRAFCACVCDTRRLNLYFPSISAFVALYYFTSFIFVFINERMFIFEYTFSSTMYVLKYIYLFSRRDAF